MQACDNYNFSNYEFERADWHNINIALSTINWDDLFGMDVSMDDCWDSFCSVLHNVFNFYIPRKNVRKLSKNTNCEARKKTKRKTYSNKIHIQSNGQETQSMAKF